MCLHVWVVSGSWHKQQTVTIALAQLRRIVRYFDRTCSVRAMFNHNVHFRAQFLEYDQSLYGRYI